MYKVLLVDDEYIVCQLLEKLIDWQGLGLELSGTAFDGYQALELMRQHRPDIVITDIRMPGLDGLSIIQRARAEELPGHFVIISGHKHFEYARKAIQYGVEDYLIKPVDQDALNRELAGLCTRLDAQREKRRRDARVRQELEQSVGKLKNRMVEDLLEGKCTAATPDDYNKEYHTKFIPGEFQCVAAKLDADKDADECRVILGKIADFFAGHFAPGGAVVEGCVYRTELYCFLCFPAGTPEAGMKELRRAYREVVLLAETFGDCRVHMGVSPVCGIGEMQGAAAKAREAAYQCMEAGPGCVFFSTPDAPPATGNLLRQSVLHNALELMDGELFRSWKEDVLEGIFSSGLPVLHRLQELERCVRVLCDAVNQAVGEEQALPEERKIQLALQVYEHATIQRVRSCCADVLEELFAVCSAAKENQTARPVREAKRYIDAHFAEEITLEEISRRVYLSPVYFSILFKSEEGVNFSKYLILVRMEKAKELLKRPDYSVGQVAELAGYRDQRHFSKLFKKTLGITPAEYRRLNQ